MRISSAIGRDPAALFIQCLHATFHRFVGSRKIPPPSFSAQLLLHAASCLTPRALRSQVLVHNAMVFDTNSILDSPGRYTHQQHR